MRQDQLVTVVVWPLTTLRVSKMKPDFINFGLWNVLFQSLMYWVLFLNPCSSDAIGAYFYKFFLIILHMSYHCEIEKLLVLSITLVTSCDIHRENEEL